MRRSKGIERRTRMLGVKLEPSLAAMVEEAAAEDGRTTSTYLYRLVKADLDRRASIAETGGTYMPRDTDSPPPKPPNQRTKQLHSKAQHA